MNNIICKICKREFNNFQSLGSHTTQFHKISKEEYYKNYILNLPNFISKCKNCDNSTRFISLVKGYSRCCGVKCSKLFDCKNPEYIKNISIKTKEAMQRPDIRRRLLNAVRKPKSDKTIQLMSEKAKLRCTKSWKENLYTKERNEKISDFKIEYWKNNPAEKKRVGNIWKSWKEKDEIGWRRHLLMAARKGFEKIMEMKEETSLEVKMYKFLEENDIKFEKQYELDYKFYDAYLPDYNILLEFDGDFWHKPELEECVYQCQKTVYHNDLNKNEIAKRHNISLFRIRENDSPEKILEYINSIKKC